MPSIGQEKLGTVMIDFFGALRRGDFDAAAGLLDPDITWRGLREDCVCHGSEEAPTSNLPRPGRASELRARPPAPREAAP